MARADSESGVVRDEPGETLGQSRTADQPDADSHFPAERDGGDHRAVKPPFYISFRK